tara:strand:- start:1249 stop:1740 length:492 start_codon:yes stop_codon:yes gene_type:complete
MANVIDNFLPDAEFKKLQEIIMGNGMPWYYNPNITNDAVDNQHFYMSHKFYGSGFTSEMFSEIVPLINAIEPDALIRVKANMYPNQGKLHQHESHFDYDFSHQAAVFGINDNDGGTIFSNGYAVESKANRIVMFDGSDLHSSTTCTNASVRVNININYTKGVE